MKLQPSPHGSFGRYAVQRKLMEKPSGARGFTLVEGMIVIAVITFLGGLIFPALAKGRTVDRAVVCLGNSRELVQAWLLYSADNAERVCNNFTLPDTEAAITTQRFNTWANNIMSWAQSGAYANSITNVDWAKRSLLAKYSSDPVGMAKCPADIFLSAAQRRLGWQARLRSVSMNCLMGAADNTQFSLSGRSWFAVNYRQFLKSADIPRPAGSWVTLDEHPDSINDGFFVNGPGSKQWNDSPASFHHGACTFSFADGHSESHPWLSSVSKAPVTTGTYVSRPFDALATRDFAWYLERTAFVPYK